MAEKKQSAADKKAAGDKKSALETALAQIEKQFGKGAVMKLGQNVTCLLYTSKIEDEPSAPKHILTVWGYGYRWNA